MKNSFIKILVSVLILGGVFVACEERSEELHDEEVQNVNDVPTADALLPDEVSLESKEVARIQKNGHEYRFVAVGQEDDMVVIERLYGADTSDKSEGNLNGRDKKTPFDIFVAITDESIVIPARIAKTTDESVLQMSGRSVDEMSGVLELLDPNYSEIQQKACYDVGFTNFRNTYCYAPVSSTPTNIEFCDNGTWTSLTRNSYFGGSWRELDDVFTWTNVICGMTRVQFYAWKKNGIWPWSSYSWHLQYQVDFTNGIWRASYYTSDYTERQVRRTRPTNSGSFRAFTRFF